MHKEKIDDELEDLIFKIKKERGVVPRVPERELAKVFPEAKQAVVENIAHYKSKSERLKVLALKKLDRTSRITDGNVRWVLKALVLEMEGKGILEAKSHIARLNRILCDFVGTKRVSKGFSESDIERIKETPIETVIGIKLQKSGDKLIGLCPLHQEKTPSLYVYTKTNTFHCFGCGAGGDVIRLIEMLYGCSFVEAINKLQNI